MAHFKAALMCISLRKTVKLNFRPYIQRYTSLNENFEYNYPLIYGTRVLSQSAQLKFNFLISQPKYGVCVLIKNAH